MNNLVRYLERVRSWHRRKMAEVAAVLPRGRTAAPFIAASVFVSNCEGELALTTDLAVEPPADIAIQQVVTPLLGLEFRRSDSATQTLEFSAADPTDLLDASGASLLRLFTDEELPEGTYTGVRLLFDDQQSDDASVLDASGAQRALVITEGTYADISLSVDEDDSTDEALTLTLDLRQSLSFDEAQAQYELNPILRSVRTEDAGEILGTITTECAGQSAVYAFRGDVEPDDIGGTGADPYLTTSAFNASYVFSFLPEGQYTLAVACNSEIEDPTVDDEIEFRGTQTVDLEEAESLQQDL
jgi:hypothetical protein